MLKDWHERKRIGAARSSDAIVAEAQQDMPGVRVMGNQPGSLGRGGSGRPFEAVLGGPDYEPLSQVVEQDDGAGAARIRACATSTRTYKERKPQIRVSVDRNRAADLGVSLQTVGRTLETVLGSRIVTTYVDRGREYNVILQSRDRRARDHHRPHQHPRALDRAATADPAVERRARSRRRRARCS